MADRDRELRSIIEAFFADHAGPPPPARVEWLIDDFHDFVRQAGPRAAMVLGGAQRAATWLAPLAIGARPPLSRLEVWQRADALEALEHTPAGLPVLALKAMLCMMYFEHDEVRAEVGADTTCLVPDAEVHP